MTGIRTRAGPAPPLAAITSPRSQWAAAAVTRTDAWLPLATTPAGGTNGGSVS